MAKALAKQEPAGANQEPAGVPANVDDGEHAMAEGSIYTQRARYFDSGNAFNLKYPDVPCHQFLAERDRALDPATGTALIPLDLSDQLGMGNPATTPLILTCYARIRSGESLGTDFNASGDLYYVIAGAGHSSKGEDRIEWAKGDVFCFPGGGVTVHAAGDEDCVLWVITNQPALAFEHLQPAPVDDAVTEAVHYPAAEIDRQLSRVRTKLQGQKIAGLALIFSHERQAKSRNILPTLTLAMNQLPPKDMQRPHRHNSVAITLNIQCEGCFSMIDGERVDWHPGAVMVTPPGAVHSHHNDGDSIMTCLIVQDGGLHYHCRTMGFEYVD